MLTRNRLKTKMINWLAENNILASENAINSICASLEDEVVEIAKEAHQRGLEGMGF